jgi:N12 class adenine-specific DNA methylase
MNIEDVMRGLSGGTVNPSKAIGSPKPIYIGGAPVKVPDEDLEKYIASASAETGVPKSYIRAIIERENAGHIANVSWKGVPGVNSDATGLGQFLSSTAKEVGITDTTDPEQSVKGTARYLKKHLDTHNGDFGKAAMRYIGGTDALGTTPESYAGDVLSNQKKFAQIYGETDTSSNQITSENVPVNKGIGPDIREQVRGILGGSQKPAVKPSLSIQDVMAGLTGQTQPEQVTDTGNRFLIGDSFAQSVMAPGGENGRARKNETGISEVGANATKISQMVDEAINDPASLKNMQENGVFLSALENDPNQLEAFSSVVSKLKANNINVKISGVRAGGNVTPELAARTNDWLKKNYPESYVDVSGLPSKDPTGIHPDSEALRSAIGGQKPVEKPFTPQFSAPPAESTSTPIEQPQKPVETQIIEKKKKPSFLNDIKRAGGKLLDMVSGVPEFFINQELQSKKATLERQIGKRLQDPNITPERKSELEQSLQKERKAIGSFEKQVKENPISSFAQDVLEKTPGIRDIYPTVGDAWKKDGIKGIVTYAAHAALEESGPTLMILGTSMVGGQAVGLGIMGAGSAGQRTRIDAGEAGISEAAKLANAYGYAAWETIPEIFGTGMLADGLKKAFFKAVKNEGEEVAKKSLLTMTKAITVSALKGWGVEFADENVTQIAELITDKVTGIDKDPAGLGERIKRYITTDMPELAAVTITGGMMTTAEKGLEYLPKNKKDNAATKPIVEPLAVEKPVEAPIAPPTVEKVQNDLGGLPEDKLVNNANNDEVWNYTIGGRKVDRINIETKANGLKAVDISKGREPLPDEHYLDLAEQSSRNDVTGQKSLAHYNSYLDAVRKGNVEDQGIQHFHLHGDEMAFGYAYKDETGKQRLIDIKADINNFGAFNETEGFGHERTNDLNTDLQAKINKILIDDKRISEAKTSKEKVSAVIKTIEGLKEDINNIRVLIPSTGKIVNLSTSFGIAENPKTSEEMLNSGKKKIGPNSIVVDDLLKKEYNIGDIKGIDRTQEYIDAGLTSKKLKADYEERQKREATESVLLQGQAGVEPVGSIRPVESGSVETGTKPTAEEVKTPEVPAKTPEAPKPVVKTEVPKRTILTGNQSLNTSRRIEVKNAEEFTPKGMSEKFFVNKEIDPVDDKLVYKVYHADTGIAVALAQDITKEGAILKFNNLVKQHGEQKILNHVNTARKETANRPVNNDPKAIAAFEKYGYLPAMYERLDTAVKAKDKDTLLKILHTGNVTSKKIFHEMTGIKLPKTNNGTLLAIKDFVRTPVKEEKKVENKRYSVIKDTKGEGWEVKGSQGKPGQKTVFGDEKAANDRADWLNKQPEVIPPMRETEITPTKGGLVGKDVKPEAKIIPRELPSGWKKEIGSISKNEDGTLPEAEVDWRNKRVVFAKQEHMDNPEIVNHEYAHIKVETLPEKEMESLLKDYGDLKEKEWNKKGWKRDWIEKNHFHREEVAMDYGSYLDDPKKVTPEIGKMFEKYFEDKKEESTNVLKKSTPEIIIKEKTKEQKTAEARERFNKKQGINPKEGDVSGKGKPEQPPTNDVGTVDRGGAKSGESTDEGGNIGKRTSGEGENLPPGGRTDGDAGTAPARSPRTGPREPVGKRGRKTGGDAGRNNEPALTDSQKKRQELLKKLGKSITGEDLSAEIGVPTELTDEQKGIAFDLVASTITDENLKDFTAVAKDVKALAGGYVQDPLFQKAIEEAYDSFAEDPDNGVSVRKVSFSAILNPPKPKPKALINYLIENADNIGEGGPEQKTNDNIEAIRILKQIEADERLATEDEQKKLVKYVGWGALSNVFNEKHKAYRQDLKDLLTDAEYAAARNSTQNAHYTAPSIVQQIWNAVMRFGFNGGNVIDPGYGIGNFMGLRPDIKMAIEGIEMDSITGRIARQLYQNAEIRIQPFETFKMPKDFYTLEISNVPFAKTSPVEPTEVKTPGIEGKPSLHNFYFLKSLYGLKPGGVLAFVTSHWTMDSINNTDVRAQMVKNADFLGAIRLPESAFKKNAGTEVVTDVIFMQKRAEGQEPSALNALFVGTKDVEYDAPKAGGKKTVQVSNYFVNKPEMVMGEQNLNGTMRGFGDNYTVQYKGEDLIGSISKAIENLPQNIMAKHIEENTDKAEANLFKDMDVIQKMPAGSFFVRDGVTYQIDFETGKPKKVKGNSEIIGKLAVLKEKVLNMYLGQRTVEGYDIKQPLAEVNKLYEDFIKKYGPIAKNIKYFDGDAFESLLQSLEVYDDETGKASKSDLLKGVVFEKEHTIETTNSTQEAVIVSLNKFGSLNIPHIAKMLGVEQQQAADMLIADRLVFKSHEDFLNGGRQAYKTRDEYLSGDVRDKLKGAKAAALKDKSFGINVSELETVIPMDKTPEQISIRMNSPILQTEDVKDFLGTLYQNTGISVSHDSFSGKWSVDIRLPRWKEDEYSTSRMSGEKIINVLMASGRPQVYDTFRDVNDSEKKVLNEEESAKAQVKADEISKKFKEWLWTDEARTNRLVRRFNDEFNSVVNREYVHPSRIIDPEAKIRFPGSAFPYPARKHQADVVWRILQSINVLLAHEVGSGKTLEMIWAGMEAKRLGLIKKPVYVFPNHMLKQWTNDFLQAYPNARLLVAKENDLKPANRRIFINRIATGNWDAVLIKREDFKSIPLSPKETSAQLQVMVDRYNDFIETLRNEDKDGNKITIKQLEAQRDAFEARIDSLMNKSKKEQGTLYFEDLGVDMLFVDEADEYKNLNYYTSLKKTKGLGDQKGSGRAINLFFKTQYMNKKKQRVVFATGTPIANSLVESYSMMRYLQNDWLEEHGIESFDDWNRIFTETVTDLELDNTGTTYKPTTRFKKITNVPSFLKALREVWDIKNGDYLQENKILIPGRDLPHHKIINVTAPATDLMKSFKRYLVRREKNLKGKKVTKGADNVLVIINDGQKAAFDLRLFNPSLPDMPDSKLNQVVGRTLEVFHKYAKQKYTQLIFLNNPRSYSKGPDGGRKVLFDSIEDMTKKFIAGGVKPEEIVDFSQKKYDKDEAKAALFKNVREGKVRILIGSVKKMGAGTNVQKLVKAIHQPYAPWNPRDIEQSNGRGIRQGNEVLDYDENGNRITPEGEKGTVEIYNYATKGSLDTGIWGLLETKSKVIKTIMKANPDNLADEIEEEYFGSVKELSIEDPVMKEAVGLRHRVKELQTLEKVHINSVSKAKSELKAIPERIKGVEERIKLFEKDVAKREPEKKGEDFSITIEGKVYDKRKDAGKALIDLIDKNENKLSEEAKKGSVKPSVTPIIGTYAGFPIRIVSEPNQGIKVAKVNGEYKNVFVLSRVEAVGKFNYVGSLNVETRNPEGMIQSLHHSLYKSMDDKLQGEKDHIAELEKSKELNQKQIDKPFAEEKELQEKKARMLEVEKILAAHTEPDVKREDEPVDWESMRIYHEVGDDSDKGDVREGDKDEGEASMGVPEAKYFEPEQYNEPVTPEPKKLKAQDSFKPGEGKGKRLGYAMASKKTGDHIVSEVSKNKGTSFLKAHEKFYTQWKTETYPIQKLAKMAEKESGIKLADAERLDFAIEKVWGAAGATKTLIDERLKPVYDAIKKNGGEIYDEANKYMVAKRTVDLYENEAKGYTDGGYDYETAKQMVDFVESGTHKFSEEIERVAEGVWKFGQKLRDIRLAHGIIDDNLYALLDEQHYVPFLRDNNETENKGAHVYGGTKFTSTNKGIMRIKGSVSGKKIVDPIQSLIKQAYETVENAARVDVANKIIDLSEKYPGIGEMIKELPPKWIKAGTIEHRMEIDVVLRPQLEEMAERLGVSVEYKAKLAGRMGGRMKKVMGMFKDDAIKLLAGSTEGTFAHELGHAINTKHEWLNGFVEKYDKEMNSVADSRFQGQEVPVSFVNYVRKPSEKIAEFISMYVTDRNTLKEIAPLAMAEFEDKISNDDILKDLIEMAPTNASGIKSVEENNFILDRTVPTDEDVVSLLRDGKVKSYRMPIEVATAMKNLHPVQLPGWIRLLAIPSQMVRAGAVGLNIDFFIPNVFRDQVDAAFNSNLIPFYDALGGLKSYLTKDKYYKQYLAEGGSMESAEAGTAGLRTSAAQIQYGSNLGQFADPYYWKTQGILKGLTTAGYYVLKSPFGGIMEMGKMSEMTTRLATYRRALKKGLSVPKAVHTARQASLEFNNIGSQMRTLNQLVPFTNVSFEGLDRMVRTWRDNPKSSALKFMIYGMTPLIALWFWNRDDDDYKLVSVRDKLNNWIIMHKDKKGGYSKIPKSHIMKFIVNPIQMTVESQLGYVQKGGWGLAADILQNVNPADFGSMPPVIRMIWEPIANYDYYWNKEIEKPTLRNIQIPGMRFDQKTNEALKKIGKALNISPIMIQHELELLGAGFAKNIFWAADVLMGDLEKEKQVAEFTPIARRFTGKVTDWNSDIDYAIRDIDKILAGMRKVSKKALQKNYGFTSKDMQELIKKQAEMRMKLLKKRYELMKAKQAIKTLNQNTD